MILYEKGVYKFMKKERYVWIAIVIVLIGLIHYTNSDYDETSASTKDYHQYTVYENDEDTSDDDEKKEKAGDAIDEIFGESDSDTNVIIEEESVALSDEPNVEEAIVEVPVSTEVASANTTSTSATKTYKSSGSSKSTSTSAKVTTAANVIDAVAGNIDQQALVNGYVTYKVAKTQIKTTAAVALTEAAIKNTLSATNTAITAANNTTKEVAKELSSSMNNLTNALNSLDLSKLNLN